MGTATLGAGVWKQLDLAGNVIEWNLDWYAAYVDPCADCAYLTAASYRVARGGYFDGAAAIFPLRLDLGPPSSRSGAIGFRCARTP